MPQTAPPTIAALPDAPQTSDGRLVFPAKADAFVAALAAFRSQANALGSNVYGNAVDAYAQAVAAAQQASASQASATLSQAQVTLASAQATAAAASAASALAAPATSATSATSMTPGTGARSFTTQSGKAFAAGQGLTITSAADPRQWMVGTVSSYSGTALGVSVTAFGQAPTGGAAADWVISFWGALPPAAKPGQVLRLRGATPEWGDVGGEPVQIITAQNLAFPSQSGGGGWYGDAVTPNFGIAPDGTQTALLITGLTYLSRTAPVTGAYTYSKCYKAVNASSVFHRLIDSSGTESWQVQLTFSTGAVEITASAALRASDASGFARQIGNGWWLVSITVHLPGPSTFFLNSQAIGGSMLASSAQVRAGNSPGLHVPTTVAEGAGAGTRRRNLVAYNKECDTAVGGFWANGAVTRIGKAISPLGDLTATVYRNDGGPGIYAAFGAVAGEQYTASVWLMLISGSVINSGGSMLYSTSNTGVALPLIGSQIDGQWRRFVVTAVSDVTAEAGLYPVLYGSGLTFAMWGLQVERGPVSSNLAVNGASVVDGQHADLQPRRVHHVDSTHAPVIVAPPVMEPGDWFEVVDIGGNAAVKPITVMRGPYSAIDGDASDFEIDVPGWGGRFVFDAEKGLVVT